MNQLTTKQNDSMIALVEKVASDPSIDASKLEKLLDMQERIFDKNAEIAFNSAMTACQKEMPAVLKESENNQTRSKYAKLDLIIKCCSPVWTKHGFALSFGLFEATKENHIGITCTISHDAGHTRVEKGEFALDDSGIKGQVNKTKTHASGSTISYFRRYLTCMIFNIPTQDDDDGTAANSTPRITEQQLADLESLIVEVGADKDKYVAKLSSSCGGIKSLEQLPAVNFDFAVNLLEMKRQAQAS